ncbi:serine/threonine-protein kinase [Bremerella sp. JC770]|uniref:serine/threonine protein kinase n=1 Tax=Bremerella sp. JC770 TaxID=3232137 RepID=UPI00345B3A69
MFSKGDKPIPGYRLERFLGRGQFGEVWAADGPGGTLVALKFIALQQKTGIRELKSIQAVKRIKHANLCSVNAMWLLGYDGDVLDDHEIELLIRNQAKDKEAASQTLAIEQTQTLNNPQYLVVSMTLADGSLEERLRSFTEGGIPREQLLDYMLQAARGIDFLNSPVHNVAGEMVGIQHRDIKPANLLFAGDSVLVGDFGVAAAFGEYDTEATSVVGSLCYMSPESIKRMPSYSSDQYALAITYYQLRTGTLPFEPTVSFAELVEIHVRGKLKFPLVSDHERAVLGKATATNPKQRYENCVEFAKALSPPVEVAASAPQSAFPLPAVIAGAIAAIVLVAALFWGVFGGDNHTNTGPQLSAHTIVFSPAGTTYDITVLPEQPREGIESTGASTANLDLLPTDKLHITAHPEGSLYQPLDEEVSYDDLVRADWKVDLKPVAPEAMLQQVTTLAVDGNWEAASALFAKAATLHPELRDTPAPESLELRGTPAVVTHSLVQRRLATAISQESSSRLGVLPLDHPVETVEHVAIGAIPYQIHLPTDIPWAVLMHDNAASVVSLDVADKAYEISLGTSDDTIYRQVIASALSPNGKSILVGQDHQMATLLAVGEGEQPITKAAESAFPTRVACVGFTPDSQYCFAMGIDGDGRRWPVEGFGNESAQDFRVDDLDEEVLAIHPVSDSRLFAFTDTKLLEMQLSADNTTVQSAHIADIRAELVVSRMSDDQKFLVYTTHGSSQPLSMLSIETGEVTSIHPPDIKGLVEDFDISADSRWLVYVNSEGAMFAVDLTQPAPAPMLLLPSPGERLKFIRVASDTMDVVTLAEDGTTTWWNLAQLLLAAQAKAN